ncbi:MAG: acyltransferase [Rhodobacteraceae bacterium]|nr:acyltransferase [Paracoccaceae bacterium]
MSETKDGDGQTEDLIQRLKQALDALQSAKLADWRRRVAVGDLLTDRAENAAKMGFGEGTTCYDNVLVIGSVKVGKHTWIGPNVILDGSGGLEIGDYVSISAGVHIYTHDTVKWATSMGREQAETSPTKIGSGVYIGPNTVISRGVTVGDRAVIGAMSLVNKDVPGGSKAWGTPARLAGTI